MAFWLVAISEAGWTSRKKKVPLGIRLNTADSHTGKKQSAKKVRLWVLIFLLFYDFCSCLRKPIFEVSGPFLLRKKSTVWESAVNQRDRATGGFVGVYTHRQSGNSRFCLFHRRKKNQKNRANARKKKRKKAQKHPPKSKHKTTPKTPTKIQQQQKSHKKTPTSHSTPRGMNQIEKPALPTGSHAKKKKSCLGFQSCRLWFPPARSSDLH